MGELLKNQFGADVPERIGAMIRSVHAEFDVDGFLTFCRDGYDALELTPRARRIAEGLATFLPADRDRAMRILIASLGSEIEGDELTGMASFVYLPHVFFVAEHGLDHFETAMEAQYELTKRFTAEFSIRAYLERHPDITLARLRLWTNDANPHVRRLVSEGSRPRLPWAQRLKGFQQDPTPVLDLLELLKDDPAEYVRRSVANNLNDIAKDHPDLVVETARRWWTKADHDGRRMIRHALRTLIKQGHEGALDVLGYGPNIPVTISAVRINPEDPAIGGSVQIEVELTNPSDDPAGALVDLRVHFVKANGSTSLKVFKGAELSLQPGESGTIRKRISLKQHSTRTHYPGTHQLDVLVNGVAHPAGSFVVGP